MAAIDLQKLLDAFQGNAYPAMVEHHAAHLNVSPESLIRLGIGWVPVVNFKKGPNYKGWWCNPERDHEGKVVGLSLRSQSDFKVMYPGSNHGLIYEVNPEHRAGGGGKYEGGAHNWCRVAENGVICPVCGKSDGCLVSSENPADPKAVICVRSSEGATKQTNLGFLHIRKAEGILDKNAGLLLPSSKPVLIVEGMSDCAAAMDMGFVAIGRPSNLAGLTELLDLVRGRDIIILGENDDVNPQTGQRPGHEGMIAAFQTLQRSAKSAKMVLPPEEHKDLRGWKTATGLTADELLAHVAETAREPEESTVFKNDNPLTAAVAYLHARHRMAGRYTLRHWGGEWWTYQGSHYDKEDEAYLEAPVYNWCENKYVQQVDSKGNTRLDPVKCNSAYIVNHLRAMRSQTIIKADAPCWVNFRVGGDPHRIIPFSNGLLDLTRLNENDSDALMDPTPDFFTTYSVPYAYNPSATCPNWLNFLDSSLGDDPEKIRLLRQWFGYCVSGEASVHKMMFMRGATAAGKSLALKMLSKLVGETNVASPDMNKLTGEFALQPLIGKKLVNMYDVRVSKGLDAQKGLAVLLGLSADDPVEVNRKNQEQKTNVKLNLRVSIAANEFLEMRDDSNALLRRLIILEFAHSFAGREDLGLEARLTAELPGIMNWALEGWRDWLASNMVFVKPESSREAEREWRAGASPVASFLEECVDYAPDYQVTKDELLDAYDAWAKERGVLKDSRSKIMRLIPTTAPQIHSKAVTVGQRREPVYAGVRLNEYATKRYLGRPR